LFFFVLLLSCPEATSLVGNLAMHSRYMVASVAYLRDQIQRKPRILQLGMEVCIFLIKMFVFIINMLIQIPFYFVD
jgi:hypothetical protein